MELNLAIKILKDTSNEQEVLETVIDELDKRRDIIIDMAIYISKQDNDEDICKYIKTNPELGCEEQDRECVSCLIEWFSDELERDMCGKEFK